MATLEQAGRAGLRLAEVEIVSFEPHGASLVHVVNFGEVINCEEPKSRFCSIFLVLRTMYLWVQGKNVMEKKMSGVSPKAGFTWRTVDRIRSVRSASHWSTGRRTRCGRGGEGGTLSRRPMRGRPDPVN
ncbi:unnamed protein product, partial [Nesidiocoris tenuis]